MQNQSNSNQIYVFYTCSGNKNGDMGQSAVLFILLSEYNLLTEFGKEKVGQTNIAKTLVTVLLSEKGSSNQEAILELMATLAESGK